MSVGVGSVEVGGECGGGLGVWRWVVSVTVGVGECECGGGECGGGGSECRGVGVQGCGSVEVGVGR